MPGRYAIVEEPEALEVIEDDVYHPDQSVSDPTNISVRSLEPIVAGPIGLKTVFFDPRWSPNQRKLCLVVLAITSVCCFAILVALFVGLGKVLSQISRLEEMKKQGLHLIPDLEKKDRTIFNYAVVAGNTTNGKSTYKRNYYMNNYVKDIKDFMKEKEEFQKKQKEDKFVDCPNASAPEDGKWCKFDKSLYGNNCTEENTYGYDQGHPCLLFIFRNVKASDWPIEERNGYLGFRCSLSADAFQRFSQHLNYTMWPKDGFLLNAIPNDESIYLAPMVWVQLHEPHKRLISATIDCKLNDAKTKFKGNDFKGLLSIKFEFDTADIGHANKDAVDELH